MLICLSNCAHPPVKERTSAFNDPDIEKEVQYLQGKLEIDQDDAESRMELGSIFLSENMFKEAIGEFEKVVSIDSGHIKAYLLLSLALQRCPNPDLSKAAELLENACELSPDNADVHLNLAQIYDKLEKDEMAINEFDNAIELSDDPATLVSSHLGLMAIYRKLGELEKSDEEYDAAYEIFPDIEKMIKLAEINRITPAPKYAGSEFREGDGIHPTLEKRIKRIREEISKMSGDSND